MEDSEAGLGLIPTPIEIVASARVEIMAELKRRNVVLVEPEARDALIDCFWATLGKYLLDIARTFPARDVWNDPELVVLKRFILNDVVRDIVRDLRGGPDNGPPTPPIGAQRASRGAKDVMKKKPIRDKCEVVLDEYHAKLGPPFVSPICEAEL